MPNHKTGRHHLGGGAPPRASQRHLVPDRARGRPPITQTLTPGAAVRWRGHSGTVARLDGHSYAIVDFAGRDWRVPIAELAPG